MCSETEGRDAGKILGKQKAKRLLFIPETDGFSSTARVSTDELIKQLPLRFLNAILG